VGVGVSIEVIAFDLSLTATGVAHPNGETETLRPPKSVDTGMARLAWFRDAIADRVPVDGVDEHADWRTLVVVEGYSFGTTRQASRAHALGELGGVVRLWLFDNDLAWVDVPPASLKRYACGKGNAKKDEVFAAAIRRLDYAGNSHDEADALWLRAMALAAYGVPVIEMPKTSRDALAAITWPVLGERDAVPA
jgi:hypothetical protein